MQWKERRQLPPERRAFGSDLGALNAILLTLRLEDSARCKALSCVCRRLACTLRSESMLLRNSRAVVAPTDVSVLMTVFNGESYVQEAIESVLQQQTNARYELIVVDDGSADRSALLVEQYCELYPKRVSLLRHPGNLNCGISASRNLALRHASSPLVAFIDCDDVFLPHHLDAQMAILSQHPEVAMVYASAERWVDHQAPFNEQEAQTAWWGSNYIPPLVPPHSACGVVQPGTLLQWMLEDESFAPCMCTVVLRTAAARAINGFEDEFQGLYDDQVFHAKLSSRFPVFAHCACTARYRQHATSCCAKASRQTKIRVQEKARFAAWVDVLCNEESLTASSQGR